MKRLFILVLLLGCGSNVGEKVLLSGGNQLVPIQEMGVDIPPSGSCPLPGPSASPSPYKCIRIVFRHNYIKCVLKERD